MHYDRFFLYRYLYVIWVWMIKSRIIRLLELKIGVLYVIFRFSDEKLHEIFEGGN